MLSNHSDQLNFNETKRFNTKEILLYFVNLLNPEKFQNLDPNLKAILAEVANALAQVGKDLQSTLASNIERMKAQLGKPAKGSKAEEVLMRLTTFENTYLPNLTIQQEERGKELGILRTQLELLIAQGANLNPTRLENFKAEIQRFKEGKLQAFLGQKDELNEKLSGIRDEVSKATGVKVAAVEAEFEEGIAMTATPPSPTITTSPATGQQPPPTPQ